MNSPSSLGPLSQTFSKNSEGANYISLPGRPVFLIHGHNAFSTRLCHKLELD